MAVFSGIKTRVFQTRVEHAIHSANHATTQKPPKLNRPWNLKSRYKTPVLAHPILAHYQISQNRFFSPLVKLAGGLYILPMFFSLFSPLGKLTWRAIYFVALISYFFTPSKARSVSTGPVFTIFSPNGRYLGEFPWSGPVFPIHQGTLPWHPILCRSRLVHWEPKYLRMRWTDFYILCTVW